MKLKLFLMSVIAAASASLVAKDLRDAQDPERVLLNPDKGGTTTTTTTVSESIWAPTNR